VSGSSIAFVLSPEQAANAPSKHNPADTASPTRMDLEAAMSEAAMHHLPGNGCVGT
jgi:hypothetical protein